LDQVLKRFVHAVSDTDKDFKVSLLEGANAQIYFAAFRFQRSGTKVKLFRLQQPRQDCSLRSTMGAGSVSTET